MTFRAQRLRRKPKVIFAQRKMQAQAQAQESSKGSSDPQPRISGSDEDAEDLTMAFPPVPPLFTTKPPLRDDLEPESESTRVQDATVEECLPFISLEGIDPELLNSNGIPRLLRQKHVNFLRQSLQSEYPAQFVAMDASRPWMLYWALAGLYMLGEDVTKYQERFVSLHCRRSRLRWNFWR
jgi:hypothetical protein